MEKLKVMRGSKDRADDVRQWLRDQGAINAEGWECNSEGWFYYVFKGEARLEHSEDELWELIPHEIVELPQPEHQFKPFDKVLVRDLDGQNWRCDLFGQIRKTSPYKYACVGSAWQQCIPYEGNEQLLGTTDSPKGGNQ